MEVPSALLPCQKASGCGTQSLYGTMCHTPPVEKAAVATDAFTDEDYFLSERNPTASVDQRELETQALELLDHPVIVKAREGAALRFRYMAGHEIPDEAMEGFDWKMEEWAYHYLVLALNSDPNYPRILGHGYGPPHEWMGMKVPGCRGFGTMENFDNHYSFIPIDGTGRYELYGKVSDPPIGDCPIWVTNCLSQSINVSGLVWPEMEFNDDGTFVVTIDPEPADGRPNHVQTSLDTLYLFMRDGRKSWDQVPNAYRFKRLDPPTAPPKSIDETLAMAARFIIGDVPQNFFFKRMIDWVEPNTVTQPEVSSNVGGMPTQQLIRGNVKIADDEALVVTFGAAESDYSVMCLYDWWGMSMDFWSRSSSMNDTQSVANPDGSQSYVVSIQDPGVHNWVDTLGLHEVQLLHRWQLLPQTPDGPGGDPWAKAELVKVADLKEVLPEGTTWVTPEERE